MSVTVYHNPKCSTSRKVLGHIRDSGIEPIIVDYLKTPLTKTELKELLGCMDVPVRLIMRDKEAIFDELMLSDLTLSDDVLLDAIAEHPVLLNRPIVASHKGVKLCRPPELVNGLI